MDLEAREPPSLGFCLTRNERARAGQEFPSEVQTPLLRSMQTRKWAKVAHRHIRIRLLRWRVRSWPSLLDVLILGGLNIDGAITGFLGLNVPVYIGLTQT